MVNKPWPYTYPAVLLFSVCLSVCLSLASSDTVNTAMSLRVERETLGDVWARMFEADKITVALLAVVMDSKVVKEDDKARRS